MASTTLKFNRGTTYKINLTYARDGVPTSLIGSTVRFTVKTAEYDSDTTDTSAVLKKNITTGDVDGKVEIIITPADTATLDPTDYFYDVKVDEQSNGVNIVDLLEGKLKLGGSPTNRLT